MPLSAGSKLGPYGIVAPLGAGGMGEVYRARDTLLDREVAIKVLPEAVAADPERLARFEREAKALAALNHPHIATIYGLTEPGGVRALVMELVPGETLRTPLPIETALGYAKQIAEALEAAHEKGITHRDLKPANIMITPDGDVKVLDFGLASVSPAAGQSDATHSPTMTIAATQAGVLLGTAAYMSPEQAAGKPVDKRADIWSFGVVLWEMLAGGRLFHGETVSHTLADVLRAPIDFDGVPNQTPAAIRQLLRRCLERDAKRRLRDIGEARIAIEEALSRPEGAQQPPGAATRPRAILPWAVAAVLGLAAAVFGLLHFRQTLPRQTAINATLLPPDGAEFAFGSSFGLPSLSPDGNFIVYGAKAKEGQTMLWLRRLDAGTSQPLAGTEIAEFPFWSPDSRWVAFGRMGKLKKIDIQGGPPVTICDFAGDFRGGSWSGRGVIVFATNAGPGARLWRVSDAGGTPAPAAPPAKTNEVYPWFLPDGTHFLYTFQQAGDIPVSVGSLDEPAKPGKIVAHAQSNAVYAQGHLLYLRESTLMAQPFDAKRLETTGEPAALAEGVPTFVQPSRGAGFTVSASGLLAYSESSALGKDRILWKDRQGNVLGNVGEPRPEIANLALSPDGRRLAVGMVAGNGVISYNIWIYDLVRGIPTRFTFGPAEEIEPVWSPDGSTIYFHRSSAIVRKASNGAANAQVVLSDSANEIPSSISPDGKLLLYFRHGPKATGWDLWVLPLTPLAGGGNRQPRVFLQTPFNEVAGRFSPDGRWVAYQSDESGQYEVYVTPFPGPGERHRISSGGGKDPRWRRDGKELFYVSGSGQLYAAQLNTANGALDVQVQKLFDGISLHNGSYEVASEGRKFLVVGSALASPPPLTLIVNWTSALRK